MVNKHPRIVIAGTNSGVGKTTIVTGILAALKLKGLQVQPFKVGPDYIDPGFHALAADANSYNLDTWLVPGEKLAKNFAYLSGNADISVIEGVMGLYDGGVKGVSSTAQIAKALRAPVILVINAKAMGQSAGAIALGYRDYDPDLNLAGVILNRIGSANHALMTKEAIENLGIPVLGIIHRNDALQTPERHLGLTPVTEIDPMDTIATMRDVMASSVDLDRLVTIAQTAPPLVIDHNESVRRNFSVRIGIAKDEAFSFYYPTALAYLESLGAELVPFSPLRDEELPDVDGVVLGGGFPEMFLNRLVANTGIQESLREAAQKGMPIYAECGGLMYLCKEVYDFSGKQYPMVGLVPAITKMEKKLQRVGYVTATARRKSILCDPGDVLRGHEFHFSTMTPEADGFAWAYDLQGSRQKESHCEGYAVGNVLASYLHLAFDGNEKATEKFLTACLAYRKGVKTCKED